MHAYRISGFPVLSEIALPGVLPMAGAADRPAIAIRQAEVPVTLSGADDCHATYQIAGDDMLLRIPGVARFLLHAGRDIAFESDGGGTDDVAIFLIGTVFGILLHQRGQAVLHASAVAVGGKAVLFCGSSGAGKSTLAAALGRRGFPMLADDVCAVVAGEGGAPIVPPDGRQLKLWSQAIDKLDLAARRGAAVRSTLQKYYVEPLQAGDAALPLGAIYLLRESHAPIPDGIECPNFVDAARLIRGNAYRPRLVAQMKQQARYLESAAAIISRAGVFILTRPLDFAALPGVIDGLEAHWRERGIGAP